MGKATIKITWEDFIENRTLEKEKRVKAYFAKKFNTDKIHLIFKPKQQNNTGELKNTEKENLTDLNYQQKLIKEWLKLNNNLTEHEAIIKLDNKINSKFDSEELPQPKKWYIKNISFDNFLSYGDNNYIDFTELKGLTMVEGGNFQGKTALFIDLLLFLFFNKTTRTTKVAEIFNIYRKDKDTINIKAELLIENETFLIERNVVRKKKKDGEYSYKTELLISQILIDGSIKNLNEEQRAQTEKVIRKAVGSEEDFLLSIIADSRNLEDLINAKATERGNVLSRFIGLDVLSKKEELCKEYFNEWKQKLKSNIYDLETLKNENLEILELKNKNDLSILEINNVLSNKENELEVLNNQKEKLLQQKIDIDPEIAILNKEEILNEIQKIEGLINLKQKEIFNLNERLNYVSEFNEELLEELNNNFNSLNENKIGLEVKLNENQKRKTYLINKLSEVKNSLTQKSDLENKLSQLNNQKIVDLIEFDEKEYGEIKSKYDEIILNESLIKNDNKNYSNLIKQLEEGEICPTCKRPLTDHNHDDEITDLKNKIKKNNSTLLNIAEEKVILQTKVQEFKDLKERIDKNKEINNNIILIENKLEILNEKIKEQKELENELNVITNANLQDQINELEKELLKTKSKILYQKQEEEKIKDKEKAELLKERYEVEIENFSLNLKITNSKLEKWIKNEEFIIKNKNIQKEIFSLDFNIKELIEQIDNEKEKIFNIKNHNVRLTEKSENNNSLIETIIKEQEFIKIFKIYLEAFGKNGIRKMILKTTIPLINYELERIMSDITDYKVEVDINDKNEVEFNMVDINTNIKKPLIAGSGYQRTIAAISLRVVLSIVSAISKPTISVFDEVLGKVAPENMENVYLLFEKIKNEFDNVFLISHTEQTKDWGEHTLVIKKDENISSIIIN